MIALMLINFIDKLSVKKAFAVFVRHIHLRTLDHAISLLHLQDSNPLNSVDISEAIG